MRFPLCLIGPSGNFRTSGFDLTKHRFADFGFPYNQYHSATCRKFSFACHLTEEMRGPHWFCPEHCQFWRSGRVSDGHFFTVQPSSLLKMRDQIQAEDQAGYVTLPKSPGQNADGIVTCWTSCGFVQFRQVRRDKDVSQPAYRSKIRPDI